MAGESTESLGSVCRGEDGARRGVGEKANGRQRGGVGIGGVLLKYSQHDDRRRRGFQLRVEASLIYAIGELERGLTSAGGSRVALHDAWDRQFFAPSHQMEARFGQYLWTPPINWLTFAYKLPALPACVIVHTYYSKSITWHKVG